MASRSYRYPFLFCVAAFIVGGQSVAAEMADDWAAIAMPTTNSVSQSIGTYAAGCIGGAIALPFSGVGYQVMRPSRGRYYGHASLIQFVQRLGRAVADQKLGTLLVGDLSQSRGGPMPSGHRSHQIGLDVDIWFLLPNRQNNRLLTANERETWVAPSMLDARSDGVDRRQWTPVHEEVLQVAALQPEVERIFVNPGIKRELCAHKSVSSSEWLRKIRPWWKHDDHFHVRLKCPDSNPYCKGQEALPEGDGCDGSLAWWFSKEAKLAIKKPVPPLVLPALCEQIMSDVAD